jgi:hypothetical protein
MFPFLLAVLIGVSHTSACDTNSVDDPDITGKWIGVVQVPNAPLDIYSLFKFEIADTAITGSGTYELYEGNTLFRTESVTVTGTFEAPSVTITLTNEDGRADSFVGELNEDGTELTGILDMPRLSISERRRDGQTDRAFWALGGKATMKFSRPTEEPSGN